MGPDEDEGERARPSADPPVSVARRPVDRRPQVGRHGEMPSGCRIGLTALTIVLIAGCTPEALGQGDDLRPRIPDACRSEAGWEPARHAPTGAQDLAATTLLQ